MMIPELINSIRNLIFTLPSQINQLVKQVNNIKLDDYHDLPLERRLGSNESQKEC